MMPPFDWHETISTRSGFIEERLSGGTPVIGVALAEGTLLFAVRRQAPKIYEIYDRLALGLIGQQSDVENLRMAALDFAHQEGFNRSEQDVTIKRVVSAMSQPLKRAFADLNTAPFVARGLFADVADRPADTSFYVMDYDGDYSVRRKAAFITGNQDAATTLREGLDSTNWESLSAEDALPKLQDLWASAVDPSGDKKFTALTQDLSVEAVLLRADRPEQAFVRLTPID